MHQEEDPMNTLPTNPPAEPARRHGIAELLRLVDALRRLAYDPTLAPDDAMRRIRDLFADHDRA
jgi:hypothetical protein